MTCFPYLPFPEHDFVMVSVGDGKFVDRFSEPPPSYNFIKPLLKKTDGYTRHECYMECTVSSSMARVSWFKGTTKLEVSTLLVGMFPTTHIILQKNP